MIDMMIARIYTMEAEHLLKKILNHLHDHAQVRGVSVFRAISGFGESGELHEARLVDLSLNLPLIVEFFDTEPRVKEVIEHLNTFVEPRHIICWPIKVS